MEILGVGMPELIFIFIIALIVLGPKDMQKTGKTIGKWLRDLTQSDGWKVFQKTSTEIRSLPRNLIRQANDELNQIGDEINPVLRQAQDSASFLKEKGSNTKKPLTRSKPYSANSMQTDTPENKISPSEESESKQNESDNPSNA